ncbi:hypothetical protein Vadar_022495 [Vaccinium darrowii]|uniref:Uncharacterized protein n=1 Tax=Vaccinium darrowii TaxID=229202 RepID=A0ACB7X330_9ERIC|nr:hypothetical protein Vadar_022495 [Vaccinium darrowii]
MAEQSDSVGLRRRLVSQTNESNSSSLIPQISLDLSIYCLLRCARSDYRSIASVNRSFRSLIRTGELYRARRQKGIVEHWVYFSFNPSGWMCFDPVGIRWMHVPRLPGGEFCANFNGALAVGTELLLFGKEVTGLQAIYKFSISTNSWSLGREMNEPRRCSFGSASLGEIAIVAGGYDRENNILSSAEIYNSDTGTWESLPRMNIPRALCSGVFMDGNFYVVGGIGVANPNALTCGEMYDSKTRRWHEIPNMLPARINAMEASPQLVVVKNELYAAFYSENEVRKYDKGRNVWSTDGSLPEGVLPMKLWGLVFSAYGDQLIVIVGGRMDLDEPSPGGIVVYDCVPDEGPLQWSLLTFNDVPIDTSFVYNYTVVGC